MEVRILEYIITTHYVSLITLISFFAVDNGQEADTNTDEGFNGDAQGRTIALLYFSLLLSLFLLLYRT